MTRAVDRQRTRYHCDRCNSNNAWASVALCPDCVREMRAENKRLRERIVIQAEFLARLKLLLDRHYDHVTAELEAFR